MVITITFFVFYGIMMYSFTPLLQKTITVVIVYEMSNTTEGAAKISRIIPRTAAPERLRPAFLTNSTTSAQCLLAFTVTA